MFFILFGAAYLLYQRAGIRSVARFAAAAVLPYALTCLVLWRAGVFPNFWFWTVTYAREYAARVPLGRGIAHFTSTFTDILAANPAIWAMAAVGAFVTVRARKAGFLAIFLLFSSLTTVPGLLFREHYFITVLPAVALLAGAAASKRWGRWALAGAIALSIRAAPIPFHHDADRGRARTLGREPRFPKRFPRRLTYARTRSLKRPSPCWARSRRSTSTRIVIPPQATSTCMD